MKYFEVGYLLLQDCYKTTDHRNTIWTDNDIKKAQLLSLSQHLSKRDMNIHVVVDERNHMPLFKKAKRKYTEWDEGKRCWALELLAILLLL